MKYDKEKLINPRELNKFVSSCQGLVKSIAKKYTHLGLDFEDLVQEGNIGLLTAIRNFDESKGIAFASYASFFIARDIKNALTKDSLMISLPDYSGRQVLMVKRARQKYVSQFHFEPDADELAAMTGLTAKQVSDALNQIDSICDIDELCKEDDEDQDCHLENHGEIAYEEDYDSCGRKRNPMEIIYDLLDMLNEKQRRVIQMLYGIDYNGGKAMRVNEITERLNVSRESVRQLKKQALEILRASPLAEELKDVIMS